MIGVSNSKALQRSLKPMTLDDIMPKHRIVVELKYACSNSTEVDKCQIAGKVTPAFSFLRFTFSVTIMLA